MITLPSIQGPSISKNHKLIFGILIVMVLLYGLSEFFKSVSPMGKILIIMLGSIMMMSFLFGVLQNTEYDSIPVGVDVVALVASVENDNSWTADRYCLTNQRTKISLWIANGEYSLDYYPKKEAFNKKEKNLLYQAVKIRLAKNAVLPQGE